MKEEVMEGIKEGAWLLYNPVAKLYAPAMSSSCQNALAMLDVLSTGNVYSSQMIAEMLEMDFRTCKSYLRALEKGGLPFEKAGTGKGGNTPQLWQLPKHNLYANENASLLKKLRVPDSYRIPNTKSLRADPFLVQNAPILYHPLSRLFLPCLREVAQTAIAILNILRDGRPHSTKFIQEFFQLETDKDTFSYYRINHILNLLKRSGLPFTPESGGQSGIWQLPTHPASHQLDRLQKVLGFYHPKPKSKSKSKKSKTVDSESSQLELDNGDEIEMEIEMEIEIKEPA